MSAQSPLAKLRSGASRMVRDHCIHPVPLCYFVWERAIPEGTKGFY